MEESKVVITYTKSKSIFKYIIYEDLKYFIYYKTKCIHISKIVSKLEEKKIRINTKVSPRP